MKQSTMWIMFLGLVLLGLVALNFGLGIDPERRNYEFLPNMVDSVAFDAQSDFDLVQAGVPVDLRPPEGSIPRGFLPLGYPATPEGALLAAAELKNPVDPEDAAAMARGNEVFVTYCAVCHGPGGKGDGAVTLRGVPPPPSLLLPHAVDMRDGQMFHVISMGQANMPSYASQVSRLDRWRAIRYVRTLQQEATRP